MTTLHALRRQHALPFSELARLTGVPVRRLAAFEYHEQPLSPHERQQLAAFFGVSQAVLQHGTLDRAHESLRSTGSPQMMATLAVAATLALSLRLHGPAAALPQPVTQAPLSAPAAAQRPEAVADLIVQRHASSAMTHGSPARPDAQTQGALPAPQRARGVNARADDQTIDVDESLSALELQSITFAPAAAQAHESPPAMPEPTPAPTPEPTPAPESPGIARIGHGAKRVPVAASAAAVAPRSATPGVPDRCPLAPQSGRIVITQGYDGMTHSPTHTWGALDLAVSGGATEGAPVIATHAGSVQVVLASWPGGNYVSVTGDVGWRTAYAHLKDVFVHSGQYVEAGTVLGTAGSTGHSTGPHLHYETWRNGVNVNPAPVLNCN
jgi:murein DD-endopeptidase MepM/ murein hydrolase activator NlpD